MSCPIDHDGREAFANKVGPHKGIVYGMWRTILMKRPSWWVFLCIIILHASLTVSLGVSIAKSPGHEENTHVLNLSPKVQHFQEKCGKGDAAKCNEIGIMYHEGRGVPRNLSEAVRFYKKACELESNVGCSNLGTMYAVGDGVKQDSLASIKFFQKGCDGGYGGACVNLGAMYGNGYGVPKDEGRAQSYFQQACEKGFAPGCTYFEKYGQR